MNSKRNKLTFTKIMIISLSLVCALSYLFLSYRDKAIMTNASVSDNVIVLDAGHGGFDGGAVGVNGAVEKDINLSITLILKNMLEVNGFEVILTRDSDINLCEDSSKTMSQRKSLDIRKRQSIIDANPNAVCICIHQNKFDDSISHGAQMFYGVNNPESKELAKCLQDAFVKNLQPDNKRQIKKGEKSVYLLCNVQNPIVLAECGFLSNPDEEYMLCDKEYQQKVAFTIFCGLIDYLSLEQNV